jgi:hypothetical protein
MWIRDAAVILSLSICENNALEADVGTLARLTQLPQFQVS